MDFEKFPRRSINTKGGFTFVEVVISCMIMMLLVAAVMHYHSSAGVPKNQEYYLKAVEVARSELEKLSALFEFDTNGSFAEFHPNGPPPNDIFLFRFGSPRRIALPNPIFRVYYRDHSGSYEGRPFLKPLGTSAPYGVNLKNSVADYHQYYQEQFETLSDDDYTDRKTFTYFTWDSNSADKTDSDPDNGKVDASIVVIDDMGSPDKGDDDLLGNIGWWVEDASGEGPGAKMKKITFALQFWYPGQKKSVDPEVIVLKTTLVEPKPLL